MGKFWVDVPGSSPRKRKTVALGICKTKSSARQRLREHLDREGVNSKEAFHQNTAPAITFRQQADSWIASLSSRRRKPVKPATISGWRDLERYWMGHAAEEVGDLYSKLKDDAAFRQEWAERIGLGFELVHSDTQNVVEVAAANAA
jgi:hypothetical protein